MTVEEKARMKAELKKADAMYFIMKWHNDLYEVASSLTEDNQCTKEVAAASVIEVMKEMQEEIAGRSRGEFDVAG
ncbi:hypothetical protein [Desulfoscipio gibsoniae]|uniref:Uncharacterized protein n=1 Tax=Desulfoscipio gibsoniae DSM 7213 TaxID=767817 RepID=R4KGM2_9FIRM|nr:hypothetical protein [Desulfoscipio gibsoniae]AGK99664.1 hypothetical protein Desgi_0044 [Desulfoscipio gibsoniae DSM 7213]